MRVAYGLVSPIKLANIKSKIMNMVFILMVTCQCLCMEFIEMSWNQSSSSR